MHPNVALLLRCNTFLSFNVMVHLVNKVEQKYTLKIIMYNKEFYKKYVLLHNIALFFWHIFILHNKYPL